MCILDFLLQSCAVVRLQYIKWCESLGYPLMNKASKTPDTSLSPNTKPTHKEPSNKMPTSLTPEQVGEQALKEKAKLEA